MKPITLLMALAVIGASAQTVRSVGGDIVVEVATVDGKPVYSVEYKGAKFIEESPLGLKTNIGDYTQGLTITKVSEAAVETVDYQLPNIKGCKPHQLASRTYTFAKDGKDVLDVEVAVGDNDVALRYKIYPQGDARCCVVESEATGFALPLGTTTFLCPQAEAMRGFARTSPSYETNYDLDQPMGGNGWGYGFTFPCLFKNAAGGWTLISETGVDGGYCASHLDCKGGNLYAIDYPDMKELNGFGTSGAQASLPCLTPWRTITIGETLAPVMETTIPFDLVEPKYEPSREYKYGKGTWSWIIKMDPSCNYDEQKRYIDFAAEMGYNSVLVDALWDTQIGYDKVAELAAYGKQKGVDLFLWYNSNGAWNDAPQGPRGKMDRSHARRQEMAWMQSIGVRGIKVDFFGGDKQPMMQLYEDILSDANDYGIEVIFHGCTLPRGWDRMYPNFVACEAVLASENLHFSQGMCDAEASNATIHPLVRNTVGAMDFGGSALNKWYNADNKPNRGSKRMTSDVFALATAVMFHSPVQHFALAPNNIDDAPAWAIDFMKEVPTTWDEVRYIDGYPGKCLVMARRHGDKWYVAGINAQDEPYKAKLTLDMFAPGQAVSVYSDDANLNGSLKQAKVNKKGQIEVCIPKNGAIVIK